MDSPSQPAKRQRQNQCGDQRLNRSPQGCAFPRQHCPHRQDNAQHQHKGRESHIEEWRTDRQFPLERNFRDQRPDRADEHHKSADCQQDVIHDQTAFAADQTENALGFHDTGTRSIQRQRTAHEHRQNRQNKHPAFRIIGKGVNAGNHARAHDKRADQAEPKGHDRQQDRPAFQAFAFFHHNRGMQQRCRQQPRHEAGVFHRVPEPEPAPAQFVIGPPRSQTDPDGQKHPCGQRPRAHPAPPCRIHAPFDQCGNSKGKRHA